MWHVREGARAKGLTRESGQVVVFFAILLPVLFGLGAIVLDIGNWYVHKRHLQTQVDAAALAAAPSFSGCFFDPATANLAIASTALSYAGDTARDPSSTNLQVQEPNDVRVTLNSQRYWAAGDPATPTTTGYGTMDPTVGDNSAGTPCATSTLDVKATDFDVPKLFSWLGIRPDIKAHARIEIHEVKEESGFLPLAVPEIDPSFVYAIFVDYATDGTKTPFAVQELKKGPQLLPTRENLHQPVPNTTRALHQLPVLGLGSEDRARGSRQHKSLHPQQHAHRRRHPRVEVRHRPVEERNAQPDLQPDADRSRPVLCGHGQRGLRRNRDAAGTRHDPRLRGQLRIPDCASCARCAADEHGVYRWHPAGEPLRPVLHQRRQRLHRRCHRESGLRDARPSGSSHDRGQPKPRRGLCAGKRFELSEHHRDGAVHLDVDRDDVGSCGRRPADAECHAADKTGPNLSNCSSPNHRRSGRILLPCRTQRTTIPARSATSSSPRWAQMDRPTARAGERSRRCELDPARELLLLGQRGPRSAAGAEAVEQPQHRPTLR